MGCGSSTYAYVTGGLPGLSGAAAAAAAASGRGAGASGNLRRLSMRPHSLETRILQVEQVDTLVMDQANNLPTATASPCMSSLRDVSSIIAALRNGELFSDPDFHNDSTCLGLTDPAGLEWKRPQDVGADSAWTGFCRGRVTEGGFGDLWLAKALSIMAMRPDLLDKVFAADPPSPSPAGPRGLVRIRLWLFGAWETVVVDDLLPIPLCLGTTQREVWPALIEKALAKLYGGYASLSGGDVLWALEHLTGGVSQHLKLPAGVGVAGHPVPVPVQGEADVLLSALYRPLRQALQAGALVSCSPVPANQISERGVAVAAVINVRRYGKRPQVCIRDATGKGPLYSGDQWVDLQDFITLYTDVIVTTLPSGTTRAQNMREEKGEWEAGLSAGGSRNNLEKFASNPQYSLAVSDPDYLGDDEEFGRCSLLLALMQEHRRSASTSPQPPTLPISFFVYKADVPGERLSAEYFLCVGEEASTGPFVKRREIAHRVELEPGNYVIIPATWVAGQQGTFLLRAYALNPFSLSALPAYSPLCAMLPTWVPIAET